MIAHKATLAGTAPQRPTAIATASRGPRQTVPSSRFILRRDVVRPRILCGVFGLMLLSAVAVAQRTDPPPQALPRSRFRSGDETLRAFAAVSEATCRSIVKLNVNGGTVALGTVVGPKGLALTKASELKPGKLTCWLAGGTEVDAEVIGVDPENDVALVRVHAANLPPMVWATEEVVVGQWAITPGIEAVPQAVGIISAPPRRIRPQRALIGVLFDFNTAKPKIAEVLTGLGAAQAGLKPGDCILAVNDRAMTNREQVVERLRDFRDGQSVRLRVRRDGQEFDATVELRAESEGGSGRNGDGGPRSRRWRESVSQRAEGFELAIQHDTVLPPWLCGGPLVNLDGQAIGLNIARAGRVATYALPPRLVKRIFETLRSGAGVRGR